MTMLIALGWAELGSVVSLLFLWVALASLFVAIVRRATRHRDHDLPRGL
jgi:hypothetical protein